MPMIVRRQPIRRRSRNRSESWALPGMAENELQKKGPAIGDNSNRLDIVLFCGPQAAEDVDADQDQDRRYNRNIERPHDLT